MSRRPRPGWLVSLGAIAAACALAAAIAVALRDDDGDRPSRTAARAAPTVPSTGAPHEAPEPPASRPPEERAAVRAARRFLAGYLPYSYGRGSTRDIEAVAAPLQATLRRSPPRVPASDRALKPRLVEPRRGQLQR